MKSYVPKGISHNETPLPPNIAVDLAQDRVRDHGEGVSSEAHQDDADVE